MLAATLCCMAAVAMSTYPQTVHALDASATAQELRECAARNTPDKSYQQAARLRVESEGRVQRELLATIAAQGGDKGLKVNFGVNAPTDLAGTTILIRAASGKDTEDMKIYLPGLQRVRNVVGSMTESNLLGTDFSYADLRRLYGTFESNDSERLPERDKDGALAFSVSSAANEETDFSRVVALLDGESCVLLEALFESEDGSIRKRLTGDPASVMKVGERQLLSKYRMESPDTGTATSVSLGAPEFDERISKSAFHPSQFYRFRNRADMPERN